ncbi:bifunctional diguanylate cyclase/phosphodiesterase [Vibrio vulnificus]|nr:bifunctional diguanylate cyclase/phosphodiesterase [Vibrio vulnificus]
MQQKCHYYNNQVEKRQMNDSTLQACIDLDELIHTLSLDGSELLNQVTLKLHSTLSSYCTCIVEIDLHHNHANTLAYAKEGSNVNAARYSLENTPFERIALKVIEHCHLIQDNVPDSCFSQEEGLEFTEAGVHAFVGIPLRGHNGDILGILVSTFGFIPHDPQLILKYHRIYANIIIHGLREKWLSDRSDQLVNQLSYEVSHDNLTGLLNRSCLSDTLETLTQQSDRPFSLVCIDIDNFKLINDINGTYIGDQIIKFTAHAIQSALPAPALAYRVAGDEFAFITYSETPEEVCEHILNKIAFGYQDNANHVRFDISIGIAKASQRLITSDELFLNASLAMKECKKHPNNRIRCYDTHLSALYHRKTQLIEAIREQLAKPIDEATEIYVAIQPIVNVHKPRWDYFEVLARWDSAEYGSISPVEFIDAAEQSGLIVQLGERIIELACRAKNYLEASLGYRVKLGVNCSAYELNDEERYLNYLNKMMQKYHLDPCDFVIELTETVLLTQTGKEHMVLDALRDRGFKVALDDFGTGYSSLNYIHSYPIDTIKIDASFIRNMLCNDTAERVVWLITQLALQLKVNLVAEGVEEELALKKLVDMGCEQIQGYYYSRPMKPSRIVDKLSAKQIKSAS